MKKNKKLRIIFLTGNLINNAIVIEKAILCQKAEVKAVFVADFLIPHQSYLQGLRFILKKTGFKYTFFKVMETVFWKILVVFHQTFSQNPRLRLMSNLSQKHNFPLIKIKDVNNIKTIKKIKSFQPDLIISMLPQKIGEEVRTIAKIAIINVHPALLPQYRGLMPYFWVLANGEKYSGTTIHYLSEKIDQGDIILKKKFLIKPKDTVQSVYYQSSLLGAEALEEVLTMFQQGKVPRKKQTNGQYFKWPTAQAVAELKNKGRKLIRLTDLFKTI